MSKIQIEKLTGPENWVSWKIQIQDLLKLKGLSRYIKKDPPTKYLESKVPSIAGDAAGGGEGGSAPKGKAPEDDSDSESSSFPEDIDSDDEDEANISGEYKAWRKKDIEALYYIRGSVKDTIVTLVQTSVTAKEAWTKLLEAHEYTTPGSIVPLMAKFWTIRYSDDKPMVEHHQTLSQLAHDINAIESGTIAPRTLGIAMLASLPEESWGVIVQTLDKGAKEYQGPEGSGPVAWERMVRIRLFDEYQRRQNAENNSAMSASMFKGKGKGKGAQNKGSGQKESEKKPGRCHNCGKKGHWKKECRSPKKDDTKDTKDAKKPDMANAAMEEIKSPEIAELSVKSSYPSSQPCLTSHPSTAPSKGSSWMSGERNKQRQRSRGYRGYNYKEIKRPCPKTDWDDDDMHLDLCDIYGDAIYDNLDYYDSVGDLCYALTGNSSK